ncbi:hypothetical protein HAX54_033670 [Datura stramonium]|uniref:Uncharacterized protein n=1 Tax=Datura stramonium TaxID=4076 RepID=A0ABS8VCP5_DATST|nr:hypothetical protein [Datura stramonium]
MQIKSDQRRSFSFSSFDFNSSNNSAGLFSSDDDEFYAGNFVTCDTEDDDDEAYIDINLNPTQTTVLVDDDGGGIKRNFHVDQEGKEYSNSSEVELRISFSSSAGIPPPPTSGTTQHAQGTTTTKPRGRLFISLARIVNEFMAASSAKTSNSARAIEANNVDCKEITRSRKDCTMVANSKRNGIINFIVKFKYKDIPSMLVSMVTPKAKSGQMRARQPLLQRGSSTCCRDPMNDDNMKLKSRNQDQNRDKSTKSSSSSVADIINFKAMRGVLDTLIVKTSRYYTSARRGTTLYANNKHNKSKSCPSSIKSSPMHGNIVCDDDEVRRFYLRDNSVQAAIAHCKRSFGTQPEFDFHL